MAADLDIKGTVLPKNEKSLSDHAHADGKSDEVS